MKRTIHNIDATNKILGRLAVQAAIFLRGKHKVNWTPNIDVGDEVIIKNVDKISFTGNKLNDKIYFKHTGYPGHMRKITLKERMAKDPKKVLKDAIRGMIPANKLRKGMMKRLIIK